MSRPRDSQRRKLYDAENSTSMRKAVPMKHMDDVEAYVEKVLKSKTWAKLVGNGYMPKLKDGRRRSNASGSATRLNFPRWSRIPIVILHEMAHMGIQRKHGYRQFAAHGPEFCALFLRLVRRFLGREAGAELKAAFKAKRVRTRAKVKRPMSEEQRAALRDRLAAARAMRGLREAA